MADSTSRRHEAGAVLLVLMVGVAVMLIGVAVAVQAWSSTWRRDSEEELMFRANQYVDGILAYRKEHNGAFPTNLEDLMKPGPRQVRYIRKLFRDPINPTGQWGLLYLMPGGMGIYDPVAAARAKKDSPTDAEGSTGPTNVNAGVTPINFDPTGTGLSATGMTGVGGVGTMANRMPGAAAGMQNPGAGGVGTFTGPGGVQGAGGQIPGGLAALRGQMTGVTGMGGAGFGGALPPPKPATGTFDEDNPSEPPIGWPVVGVISRVTGALDDKTFKVYKGHDKVSDWQFHVFDRGMETGQAPQGAVPGGSPAPFLGPGFGGTGPIGGIGGGAMGGHGGLFPGGGGGGFGGLGGGTGGGIQRRNGPAPPTGGRQPN